IKADTRPVVAAAILHVAGDGRVALDSSSDVVARITFGARILASGMRRKPAPGIGISDQSRTTEAAALQAWQRDEGARPSMHRSLFWARRRQRPPEARGEAAAISWRGA